MSKGNGAPNKETIFNIPQYIVASEVEECHKINKAINKSIIVCAVPI